MEFLFPQFLFIINLKTEAPRHSPGSPQSPHSSGGAEHPTENSNPSSRAPYFSLLSLMISPSVLRTSASRPVIPEMGLIDCHNSCVWKIPKDNHSRGGRRRTRRSHHLSRPSIPPAQVALGKAVTNVISLSPNLANDLVDTCTYGAKAGCQTQINLPCLIP